MTTHQDFKIFNDMADNFLSRVPNQHRLFNEIELHAIAGFLLDSYIDEHSAMKLFSEKFRLTWDFTLTIFTNMKMLRGLLDKQLDDANDN